jgi:hypothetical protein
MAQQITYGGIALNLDTPEITAFLDDYLPLSDARWTTPQRVYPGPRLLSASRPVHNVNRPALALGQWFYPVGMSRWSEVHLIVTETNYSQILAAAFDQDGNPVANTLSWTQNGIEIATQMYVLDIRPIARMASQPPVWVLSLVDERYYFNFTPLTLTIGNTTQWSDLVTDITTALDITATQDTIPAAYLQPEPDSDLQASSENAAILADTVAANVGVRWVRELSGTYYLQNVTTANGFVVLNKQTVWAAGGDALQDSVLTNAVLPGSVKVSFPKWFNGGFVNPQRNHIPYCKNTGDEYTVTIGLNTVSGFTDFKGSIAVKIFHDTGRAVFASLLDTSPTNVGQLNDLAAQIALDYYGGLPMALTKPFPCSSGDRWKGITT